MKVNQLKINIIIEYVKKLKNKLEANTFGRGLIWGRAKIKDQTNCGAKSELRPGQAKQD